MKICSLLRANPKKDFLEFLSFFMFDKIIQFFFEGLQETFKIFAIQLFAVSIVKF